MGKILITEKWYYCSFKFHTILDLRFFPFHANCGGCLVADDRACNEHNLHEGTDVPGIQKRTYWLYIARGATRRAVAELLSALTSSFKKYIK